MAEAFDVGVKDYYAALGVPAYASRKRIRDARRRLVKHYRRFDTPAAHNVLSAIEEAFSVLGDDSRRRAYDIVRFGPDAKTPSSSWLSLDGEGSWSLLGGAFLTVVFGALLLNEQGHPVAARVLAIGGMLLVLEAGVLMVVTFIRHSSPQRLRSLRRPIALALLGHIAFATATILLLR